MSLLSFAATLIVTISSFVPTNSAHAAEPEIYWAANNTHATISVAADRAIRWREGSYDVWVLEGKCLVNQELTYARSARAVLWIDREGAESGKPTKVIAYLEGDVRINSGKTSTIEDQTWFGRFYTTSGVSVSAPVTAGTPREKSLPVYQRALARFQQGRTGAVRSAGVRATAVHPVQYTGSGAQPEMIVTLPPGTAEIRRGKAKRVSQIQVMGTNRMTKGTPKASQRRKLTCMP